MKTYITKKIIISSDHAGYSLKKKLIAYFNKFNLDIVDLGPFDESSVDYPDYAKKLCKKHGMAPSKENYLAILRKYVEQRENA